MRKINFKLIICNELKHKYIKYNLRRTEKNHIIKMALKKIYNVSEKSTRKKKKVKMLG